jgi:hypothetical protein
MTRPGDQPEASGGSATARREAARHEALCRRCGRCCYEKLLVDGRVFTTRKPCPHLDATSNLCTVYEERFARNPRCLTVAEGIEWGVFPKDCPYVKDLPGYVPAVEGRLSDELLAQIENGKLLSADDILAEMKRDGRDRGT